MAALQGRRMAALLLIRLPYPTFRGYSTFRAGIALIGRLAPTSPIFCGGAFPSFMPA
jgi:hypothetical protein